MVGARRESRDGALGVHFSGEWRECSSENENDQSLFSCELWQLSHVTGPTKRDISLEVGELFLYL